MSSSGEFRGILETMHGNNVLKFLYDCCQPGVTPSQQSRKWEIVQDELEVLEAYESGERTYKVVL